MITLSQLTTLLGWASVINIIYLLIATLTIMYMRDSISSLHSKMLGIDKKQLVDKYFDFLSMYKVVTLAIMLSPYIALKIMGQ